MLDSLADHFELADRRVLPHSIGEERVATRLGVLDDVVDRRECVPGRRGRPSQSGRFGKDALLKIRAQTIGGQHGYAPLEQRLQILLECDHIQQRPPGFDIDEKIDIAVGSIVTTRD